MSSYLRKLILALMLVAPLVVPGSLTATYAAAPAIPTAQGPIDIQANEQEFAADAVIAKGDVRVKYKDSLIFAPMARLMKDATGNPQMAIFTGHPRLLQGHNKIDADKLTFELSTSKVLAEGNAHSEVLDNATTDDSKTSTAGSGAMPMAISAPPVAPPGSDTATDTATDSGAAGSDKDKSAEKKPSNPLDNVSKADAAAPPEKIFTDSDRQEYDRSSGKFLAQGHVRLVHDNIIVKADKLQLVYGLDNKPETAMFTGGVNATQDRNVTTSDTMVYSLASRRLQATGHVRSTVIQDKKVDPKKKKVAFDPLGTPSAEAATAAANADDDPDDDMVVITSISQDFSKDTNRMSANGNVKFYYQDMIGTGPSAILIRNAQNKAERIVFSGRSQISQPGKRWIADHIEMIVADKRVLASGNSRAFLTAQPKKATPDDSKPQAQPQPPPNSQMQLAGSDRNAISVTKVEKTQ